MMLKITYNLPGLGQRSLQMSLTRYLNHNFADTLKRVGATDIQVRSIPHKKPH